MGSVLGTNTSQNLFESIKISNQPFAVIDILVVAFIIYLFYIFLRQTRAMAILYGILVLALFWLIGRALNLTLLNTILRWTFTSLLVAIPVVFQPELRNALEKIGRSTKIVTEIQRLSKTDLQKIVEEIISSVKYLSKNKYGAIIVIGRNSGLQEYINTGELLYANLNYKLIVNIFTPKAPLHDGAMIILGNKIISVSCTLPIADSVVDLTLGTRHKAGLSVSQETDAVCIIVSEETGSVSLAVNSKIQKYQNITELHERLLKLLNVRSIFKNKK